MTIKKQIKERLDIISKNINFLKKDIYVNQIIDIYKILLSAIKTKKKILFCGNGGSAADSQHLAAELVGKFLYKRQAISAIALTCDTSIITSISNDDLFENIFSRQIEALGKKNDILYAISTSGSSKNILKALLVAKKKKMKTILITGGNFKSSKENKFIDKVFCVPAKRVDRIQELHLCVGHFICEFLEKKYANNQ